MIKGHKKRIKIAAMVVIALSLFAGVMYTGAGYALKPLATQWIRHNGFPSASLDTMTFTPTGVMIDAVSLDGNGFTTMGGIILTINWQDFFKTRAVKTITIKDIAVACEIDPNGHIKIAGWDATLPQAQQKSGSALLPLQSLILQGITADCDTPHGNVRIEGKLSLNTVSPTEQAINIAVWGQQNQISFDAKGQGTLLASGEKSLSVTLNDGRMNIPLLLINRASGWLDIKQTNTSAPIDYKGQLIAGKINLGETLLLQNVTANLDTSKPDRLSMTTSPAGFRDVVMTAQWFNDPTDRLILEINSLSTLDAVKAFLPDKIDTVAPWVKSYNPLRLTLESSSEVIKNSQKTITFQLSLGDEKNKKSPATLSTNGTITYNAEDGRITAHCAKTTLDIAGGLVTAAPVTFDSTTWHKNKTDMVFSVQSIDMKELANLVDVDGFRAEGRVSGTIPITYQGGDITLGNVTLKNDGKGQFAYSPAIPPAAIAGDDARMQTVRDAVKDFRFTLLDVSMTTDKKNNSKTTLKAEGTSPAFPDRPIHLNLSLEGDVVKLLKQVLQIGSYPNQLITP